MSSSLMGKHKVTEAEIKRVPTPPRAGRWFPVGHWTILKTVYDQLDDLGLNIVAKQFGLARDGAQVFATLDVEGKRATPDGLGLSIGVRGSVDKSLSAGICFGSRIFVCDNLAFYGEVVLRRRYTENMLQRLQLDVKGALGEYPTYARKQRAMFKQLRAVTLRDKQVHDLVIRAMYGGIITTSSIEPVLDEWREPGATFSNPTQKKRVHRAFLARNAWSLFNAFTARLKLDYNRNAILGATKLIKLSAFFEDAFPVTGH